MQTHAGSWYEEKGTVLSGQLQKWLEKVTHKSNGNVRAAICPHAGYSYSGPSAAHSYRHLDPSKVERVFILGPSHHHYTKRCELSQLSTYLTPVGNLTLDRSVIDSLHKTEAFDKMSQDVDEAEHSIEMQLPYARLRCDVC